MTIDLNADQQRAFEKACARLQGCHTPEMVAAALVGQFATAPAAARQWLDEAIRRLQPASPTIWLALRQQKSARR
ncbi:MAG: hypothetical protein HYV75_10830 [Opitutae bacterium]|nr:hypothetical protein [Opitutae bacterium]